MMNRNSCLLITSIVLAGLAMIMPTDLCSQSGSQPGEYIFWSRERPLTASDFKIQKSTREAGQVFSQFTINVNGIRGLDFLKYNFNRNVENLFLPYASWIDTTDQEKLRDQLEFQQLQFDLAEVHVRKFRQELLRNKKALAFGKAIMDTLNEHAMSGLSRDRLKLFEDTEGGLDPLQRAAWRKRIEQQLDELAVFDFNNRQKIRLKDQ